MFEVPSIAAAFPFKETMIRPSAANFKSWSPVMTTNRRLLIINIISFTFPDPFHTGVNALYFSFTIFFFIHLFNLSLNLESIYKNLSILLPR